MPGRDPEARDRVERFLKRAEGALRGSRDQPTFSAEPKVFQDGLRPAHEPRGLPLRGRNLRHLEVRTEFLAVKRLRSGTDSCIVRVHEKQGDASAACIEGVSSSGADHRRLTGEGLLVQLQRDVRLQAHHELNGVVRVALRGRRRPHIQQATRRDHESAAPIGSAHSEGLSSRQEYSAGGTNRLSCGPRTRMPPGRRNRGPSAITASPRRQGGGAH